MALSNTAVPVEYGAFRQAVLRGEIPVNQEISMEMNRIDFLIESPDYYYDDEAIQGYVDFCESELTLTDGADLTLLPTFRLWAECALAWFYFVDEKVWNPERRRYELVTIKKRLTNKQYLIVARGAAKSMYCSTVHSYFLNVDTTTTHQVITAPTMKQAEETIAPMRTSISRSRGPLYKYLTSGSKLSNTYTKQKLSPTKKGIENFITNSLCEVRPMSVDKLQGLGTKLNTVDEWLSGHVKEDVIGALEQGASKVDDYLIIATSSEGNERDGVGDSIKMELMSILRGEYFAPNVSIWYYRLDDIREVSNPELWLKANPNLGATVSYDTYEKEVRRMEAVPSSRNEILAKRFGVPVEGLTYFFTYEQTELHPRQNFDGLPCAVGADLSQGDDFCAFTFLFPLGGGRYGVKTRSYVSDLKVRKLPLAMRKKYDEFVDERTLVIMEGAVLNMEEVAEDLEDYMVKHQYAPIALGYDPYNAAWFVNWWTLRYGSYGVEVVRQGVKTESVPLGELGYMAEDRLLIFDEELMKFAMGNAIAIEDTNGNRKLSKKRSIEKIDNVAALLDAWVAYTRNQEAFE
jgi:phage terminase large subunit-like protein